MKYLNKLKNFDALKIYLSSSEEILSWSYGEVTKSETINYRTFKPEREGLFDERIFGPSKNYECYCGKYKGIRYKNVVCDKCGVEITNRRVRRERMGHIVLASPVAHVWFFRGIPSKMALLLDLSPRNVEAIVYFAAFVVTEINLEKKAKAISSIEKDFQSVRKHLLKEMEVELKEFVKEIKRLGKQKDELKAQEEILKVKQKAQLIRDSYGKSIDEQEKMFALIRKKIESVNLHSVISDSEYVTLSNYLDQFCGLEIGAEALKNTLNKMDLNELSKKLRSESESVKGQKAAKLLKRLKVVEQFRRADLEPSRMILDVIPIIPPDLRPMVQLDGGRFASSDLNDLYRRLINRNNRLRRLLNLGAPEIIVRNEKRMLQEAVDALFDSSKQRQRTRITRGKKQLRSLTDMIKGKQGIFRLNLLGKRVDYSGRAVIIDGPELKLHECGLPKEMALELFKPMVLREILSRGYAPNVKSAKFFLDERSPEVWDILEEAVKDHPVLLNRAPTLWRLGMQAFYPRLIEGNAIKLHLAVVTGYNADFDGDQMAVHVPLSKEAINEAKELMLSTKNLFKPSDGSPISVPQKTLLFGSYYVTSIDESFPVFERVFSSKSELTYALDITKEVQLRQRVKVSLNGKVIETTPGRVIFNEIIPKSQGFINDTVHGKRALNILSNVLAADNPEVGVRLIDALKDIGSDYGTICGLSVGISDIVVPKTKGKIINRGKKTVDEIENNWKRGLITETESKRLTEDAWNKSIKELDDAAWDELSEDNPIKSLIDSGSTRASRDQLKQLSGMKGLVADPTGKVVEMPIFGNYKHGLSAIEYFVGSRGARKGLVDKGLKTADAGYLTRRLVDVSQDLLIREKDCKTEDGREMIVGKGTLLQTFSERVVGRYLSVGVKGRKKSVVQKGTLLKSEDVEKIEKAKVKSILIRSPLHCETRRGVCAKCYGLDLTTGKEVKLGSAVGVAAAQSIGEPGTQLTMRTFHTGGIATKDITSGLPRIEEVVEARTPKSVSIMSEVSGKVKVVRNGDDRKIIINPTDSEDDPVEYQVDPIDEIGVDNGQLVAKGEKLTSGHLNLTDLYASVGPDGTKKYIMNEIQSVYASQGVVINDKHIEVIVNQMFNHIRVEDPGDTDFMTSELVTKASFQEENENVIAGGGEPATGKLNLLGITKASLMTDSFLSAASFIQTSNVLTDAAASGKIDNLLGLKENVILGRLIPTEIGSGGQ